MKIKVIQLAIICFSLLGGGNCIAQWIATGTDIYNSNAGNIGIGTVGATNAAAKLEIRSTTGGFLMPRLSKTQRDAIGSPIAGLMIYQTNSIPGFYYYDGAKWVAVIQKSKGWQLTGNSGTDPSINFLGTTDAKDLVFRVNNSRSGLIEYSSALANTSFGFQALNLILTGQNNTATGYNSLYQNSAGSGNTAMGAYAMFVNTSGYSNTAIGIHALHTNKTGNNLIAVGDSALYNNTSGIQNTVVGSKAGYAVTTAAYNSFFGFNSGKATTTGNWNTAVGSESLKANTTGVSNTAVGEKSMISNTSGKENIAIGSGSLQNNTIGNDNSAHGFWSLYNNTTGSNNTANGKEALYSNKTGYSNVAIGTGALHSAISNNNMVAIGDSALYNYNSTFGFGSNNNSTAIGSKALFSTTTGHSNTCAGFATLMMNTTGSYNTAFGKDALHQNITGDFNTAIGVASLSNNKFGSDNTALGYFADVSDANFVNSTAVGFGAIAGQSNKVRVGNSDVTSIGGHVSWTTFSDFRFAKNIKEDVKGLAFINSLRPLTYTINVAALDDHFNEKRKNDPEFKKAQMLYSENQDEASNITYTGLVAQEVEAAAQKLNYNFSGIDKPKTEDGIYGLRYSDFVVPLVKAVQELSKMIVDKDAKINNFQKQLDTQQKQIDELKSIILSGNQTSFEQKNLKATVLNNASLQQNIPNPFHYITTINYFLPQQFSSAKIIVKNETGKILKELNVSASGKGSIKVDASTLSSGAYQYSLIANGKLIDTKQMILAK